MPSTSTSSANQQRGLEREVSAVAEEELAAASEQDRELRDETGHRRATPSIETPS